MIPYTGLIEAHYARHWGPVERARVSRGCGLPDDFRVLTIPRADHMTAYATCGMSRADDDFRLELFLLSRRGADPGPPPLARLPR